MMIRTLAAGAALAMLVAGGASAGTHAKSSTASTSPKQPIPYAQLDAYLKASPKERASKDWWSGSASTGVSADTSATASTPPAAADTSVNPPASTSMPSDSSTSMPSTPPTMPESSSPAPGSNLPGSTTTPGAPTEQK